MSDLRRRWRNWRNATAASRRHGLTTYPHCEHVLGHESCCCGVPGCTDGGEGLPVFCYARIPLWRYLLIGTCGNHQGGAA